MSRTNTESGKVRRSILGHRIFYNCPKCGKVLEFGKRNRGWGKCLKCGQKLDWSGLEDIPSVYLKVNNAEEAEYWIGQYETMNGTLYDFSTNSFLKSRRRWPAVLYFPFPESKMYGRFVRMASKESKIVKGEKP